MSPRKLSSNECHDTVLLWVPEQLQSEQDENAEDNGRHHSRMSNGRRYQSSAVAFRLAI